MTVVGSYPQPGWLIDRERLGDRLPPRRAVRVSFGASTSPTEEAQDDATRLAVADMEAAGVDVVTDGEMRRRRATNRFATALDGVDLEHARGGARPHRPPEPRAARRRPDPPRRARRDARRRVPRGSLTERRIKITVPGPFTMAQHAQDDHYGD